jgi:uncharacterized membrane protein YkgB
VLSATIITAAVSIVLSSVSWPFVDLYRLFRDAAAASWPETFADAFRSGVEYRPLLTIGVKLSHQLIGLRAWCYQALVVAQFAAVLAALIWIFQPRTRARALAACLALACVVGLHSSRVLFMFVPLNAYSMGLVLLLVGVILALSPSRAREWLFLPLTLAALLLLESGALIVGVTLVLWKMKAPGVGGRAVAATLAAAAVYLGVRLAFSDQVVGATYAETGLGFSDVSAPRLAEIFANAPWVLWIYNIVASLLTVVASEPRGGRYLFLEAILNGHVPGWMYLHVLTSLLTTAVVVYALRTSRITDARDRAVAGAGLAMVIFGSALGFLYTRDRIALSAGIGYAMLVYVAVTVVLQQTVTAYRSSIATLCVAVIAVGWLIRVGETCFALRDTAWEHHLEWTTRYAELGGPTRPQTDILLELRRQALARVPDDPRHDPAWTYWFFQRANDRVTSTDGSVDDR